MSNRNETIRHNLTTEDYNSIRNILESTEFFYEYEVEVAMELVDEYLAKGEKSGYYFLVSEEEGRVTGYCCYGPIACTDGSYDLYWIAVHKEYQGKGIGKQLLIETEKQIHTMGGRGIYVETASRPQYTPTRAFYEKNNYIIEAVLKEFYSPGDDKVIFVKRLTSE